MVIKLKIFPCVRFCHNKVIAGTKATALCTADSTSVGASYSAGILRYSERSIVRNNLNFYRLSISASLTLMPEASLHPLRSVTVYGY